LERLGVVGADGRVVLDDGDAARHASDYSGTRHRDRLPPDCQNLPAPRHRFDPARPAAKVSMGLTMKRPVIDLLAFVALATAIGLGAGVALGGVAALFALGAA